ncbi:hypothetical protein KC333_g6687 [Hortaea werneckii]|nr:hypothetical protein KC333_g6687 [Hortaea werneckii]KAI7310682.1 hypothetical protein KC326_g6602 [Hortaea werneckii]
MTSNESPKYKAFAAAPRQKKISIDRRATVRRTTPALPPKTESQASFTQQYPHWLTPIEHHPGRLQEAETDDDEYEEPRPKKRRKKSERERGQATYTQMTKAILGREPTPKVAVGADGWQVPDSSIIGSDGSGHEDVGRMDAIKQRQRARNAGGIQCTDWTPQNDDSGYETRVDGTGEIHRHMSTSPSQPFAQTTPPTAIKLQTPKRHRFSKDAEIPSSQSPVSGKLLSTQKSQRFRNFGRSPLKERSVNAPSPTKHTRGSQKRKAQGSPPKVTDAEIMQESQGISPVKFKLAPRLLANVGEAEIRKSAVALGRGDDGGRKTQDESVLADQDDLLSARPSRKLKRTKTVQDSQYEDLDLSDESDFQDDYGDEGLDDTYQERCREDEFNNEDFGEEAELSDREDIQLTYDPAWSALDRDAARFCQPPTQMQTQIKLEPHVSNSTTTIEDLERESLGGGTSDEVERKPSQELGSDDLQGIQNEVQQKDQDPEANAQSRVDAAPPRSQNRVLRKYVSNSTCADDDEDEDLEEDLDGFPDRSQELGSSDLEDGMRVLSSQQTEKRGPREPPVFVAQSKPQTPPGELSASKKQQRPPIPNEDDESRIPSSPPPLRPSQVSTVAGTQLSPSRLKDTQRPPHLTLASPRIRPQPDLIPSSSKPSSPTAPASPNGKQPFSQWPETFPSSPLPLPPWSSPPRLHETQASKARSQTQTRGARGSIGLGSLADFSLPPPPPMSSSSRPGTQACGGSSSAAE